MLPVTPPGPVNYPKTRWVLLTNGDKLGGHLAAWCERSHETPNFKSRLRHREQLSSSSTIS